MGIPRNVKQYLFHHQAGYSHKQHSVAFTSQEIAQVEHIPGAEFAKTVVLQADGRPILAVLPGDHLINLDVLKKQIGCSKLSLAREKDFIENFPMCEPGGMPPFGNLFGLPLYCDTALAKQSEIEFNAGTHVDTIRMAYSTFAKLENPNTCSFSDKYSLRHAVRTA